ncbi:hypothetical protein A2954_01425 [Candidatus Roizmanbacteria bacterium RIFCSPLOWO2_01_FULL_37_12]|uniref:Methyltransferase domain-containing protein n=1 Tax=Candidatus Roizmanbacteria bacterium RIFCSPLOWO2_01_FULL_37_12 TaxID=1802056 RepID=A0A1F7IGJ1_9BACT|nr:MAG: hypothetical protein A2954_01425 [Candidatus Roizmanbacteria bacterium RIFCSPLOWO2_01_FULL_37_12]
MQCFLCKKSGFEKVYTLKTKNILCCKNDGLILGETTAYNKINIYGTEYFSNEPNRFNQNYFKTKLLTLKHLTLNKKPQVLDIGCGWGDFEEVLEAEKIPYLGIDVNKEAIEICKKKGLNCEHLTIDQLLNYKKQDTRYKQLSNNNNQKSKKFEELKFGNWNFFGKLVSWNLEFDCITLFQVIEHLKNPIPLLQAAKKLLKKNGLILITTPNNDSPLRKLMGSRWSVYNEPSHYVFYNQKTLEKTLQLAGFKKIHIKIDQPRFLSSNYILNRFKQMYFPTFNFSFLTFNLPIPTDPFGDLEASAFINYDK